MNFAAKKPHLLRGFARFIRSVFIFVILIGGIIAAFGGGYRENYRDKIFPGVSINNIPVSGLTTSEAKTRVQSAIDTALARGIAFRIEDENFSLPTVYGLRSTVSYDLPRALADATHLGRRGPLLAQWVETAWLRIYKEDVTLPSSVDDQFVETFLGKTLAEKITEPQNAALSIAIASPKAKPVITLTPERTGRAFDISSAITALHSQAEQMSFQPITIPEHIKQPDITSADLEEAAKDLPRWIAALPLRLTAEGQTWIIQIPDFVKWLVPSHQENGWHLALSSPHVRDALLPLADPFLKPSKNGYLKITDGRATEFTPPVEGVALDVTSTIQNINDGIVAGSSTIQLVLVHEQPLVAGDAEQLGIREVLGVGRSNFSGSPTNRRKNIALGAKKVNGSLLAPGEEFSLLKTLGKVNGENGWLPELVIKGDKTTPEFGGGLCQIGTTTFRMTLAGGMPITERQNHSYRVRYYEPAGTDATIYEPKPDYRFKNDTEHWLLVTTEIRKDDLAFTLWGTRDGRVAEQTAPKIYNIVPPPEKKIIETLELEPGKTKCTEVAHAGADASFDYAVTYADGAIKKRTFTSHYRPWGAVCLLGVKTLTASSTTNGVDESGVNNPN